jgi:IclR family transcriptional regulator, pca regulon regulatory protein
MTKLTPRTVADTSVLRAAIITAREQGYCIVDEEAELGLRSAAVPVRRYDGAVPCAIQVGVRTELVSIGRIHDEILPVLREAAAELGRALV